MKTAEEYVAAYDRDPLYLVCQANGFTRKHLGGIPTPALVEAGYRAVDAWRTAAGSWRLRDDEFDAINKPADVSYVRVRIIHNERPAGKAW